LQPEAAKAWFHRQLRAALVSLYDPAVLRSSPALAIFGLSDRADPAGALRRLLAEAIDTLRPVQATPPGSKSWRVYQVLRQRYIEQLSQTEVAAALALSIRQLQREEKLAREVLADLLLARYDLEEQVAELAAAQGPGRDPDNHDTTSHAAREEIARLRASSPDELTDIALLLADVLETIAPLLRQIKVEVLYTRPASSDPVAVSTVLLRQALLALVEAAAALAPGGRIAVSLSELASELVVEVCATSGEEGDTCGHGARTSKPQGLGLARELVQLCGGTCFAQDPQPGEACRAVVRLPRAEQVTVLAVDDNADALRLLQRYLAGTRFRLVGAADTDQALSLAIELRPSTILLDVMMPRRDGWTLLTMLREHPATRAIPAIVCTILGQRELAFALGAADYIQKPVSRRDLIAALERQLAPPATDVHSGS
jgi:CheY-like chemotaxis protein